MYKLPSFTETDQGKLIAFMKQNSFAVVVASGDGYPVATHLPLHVEVAEDGNIFLSGHLMKQTDHHRAFQQNPAVLVIFNGPHAYVSASWYQQPQSASTWNYMTVHAKGRIEFMDQDGTYQAIKDITDKYEGQHSGAAFDQLPREYVQQHLKAIVGFKIKVESLENVFKLSQNHTAENRERIIKHLEERGDEHSAAVAAAMRATELPTE